MINHARTLLLNQDGVGFSGFVGEEYTPPDFTTVELPSFCRDIRRVLFGDNPDWLMFNYRAYELTTMLASTELTEFVTAFDSRITYSTNNSATPFEEVFPFQRASVGSTVVIPVGGTTAGLYPTTNFTAPDVTGQCYQQWSINQTSTQFHITHETRPRKLVSEDATYTNGLSNLVPLPESSLQFRADQDSSSQWRLEAYSQPQRGLGGLEAGIGALSEETMFELFHIGDPEGNEEPWMTWRNLWNDNTETAYRLGAVVLALIQHTHDIWNVG
jgi:hypothetical protein